MPKNSRAHERGSLASTWSTWHRACAGGRRWSFAGCPQGLRQVLEHEAALVRTGTSAQPPPLLLAFHWRPGNARDFAGYWRAGAGARGVLLAVAQSSQLEGMEEYVWDDPARALRDAQTLVGAVRRAHRFDEDAVVLAGASQGAALATSLALQGQPVARHIY